MARSRSTHPPAWYPDPADPGRIRRWNGRAWTEEVRPLPDWLRTLRLSPGPPARVPRASRRLWLTSGGMLVLGGLLLLVIGSFEDAAAGDRIGDRAFVRAANARCARTALDVVAANGRSLSSPSAEVRRIHRLATGWEDMVDDVRALPVSSKDAPAVDSWLREWDRWTALGRDYADALAVEEGAIARDADAILRQSAAVQASLTRFALVNDMPDCVFR